MEKLSQHWQSIQGKLFPWLREELGPLSEKQQQLVTVLEMARLEEFIKRWAGRCVGRPLEDRRAIARAFVAKAVYNMPTTVVLIERLVNDTSLRRLCGWERKSEVPSESTFSRAFAEFAERGLPASVHEALIKTYRSETLVGHISRDSTAIEARERVCREAKQRAKEKKAAEKEKKRGKAQKQAGTSRTGN